jgi:hypothetical protein
MIRRKFPRIVFPFFSQENLLKFQEISQSKSFDCVPISIDLTQYQNWDKRDHVQAMLCKLNPYIYAEDGNIKHLINRFNLTRRFTVVTGTDLLHLVKLND